MMNQPRTKSLSASTSWTMKATEYSSWTSVNNRHASWNHLERSSRRNMTNTIYDKNYLHAMPTRITGLMWPTSKAMNMTSPRKTLNQVWMPLQIYITVQCHTKIMVLPSWNCPQARRHVSVQIIYWNESVQLSNLPLPRGEKKSSRWHYWILEYQDVHCPDGYLVARAHLAQNMEV